jgi:hypothetical protein
VTNVIAVLPDRASAAAAKGRVPKSSAVADVQLSPAGDTFRSIPLYSTLPQEEFQISQEAP